MNTEPAPYYQQPQTPPKQKRSGCLTAFLIFLAFGLVVLIAGGILAWKLFQHPAVQSAVEAVGGMVNAPGRAELERAGCQQAMVMDLRAFAKLAEEAKDTAKDVEALRDSVMIVCVAPTSSTLTCPQVATAYATAVPTGASQLHIQLQRVGQQDAICQGIYDRTGAYVGISHFNDKAAPTGPETR